MEMQDAFSQMLVKSKSTENGNGEVKTGESEQSAAAKKAKVEANATTNARSTSKNKIRGRAPPAPTKSVFQTTRDAADEHLPFSPFPLSKRLREMTVNFSSPCHTAKIQSTMHTTQTRLSGAREELARLQSKQLRWTEHP